MASFASKIVSNTMYQILGRFFSAAETLAVTFLITRTLGPARFGEITLVITYVSTFFVMADFGINTIAVRNWTASKEGVKKELGQIVVLRLLLAGLLGIVAVASALVAAHFSPQYTRTVVWGIIVGTILIFGQSIYFSASSIFQTFFSYSKAFWATVGGNIAAFCLVLIALWLKADSFGLLLALIGGALIPPVLAIYFVRDFFDLKDFKIDTIYWKKLLFAALPTGLGLILNTLFTSADRFLLSILSTSTSLGIYGLAYKVFENVLIIPNFFMNASFPAMMLHRQESTERLKQTVQKVFDGISLAVFPITVMGVILSTPIIRLLGGEAFEAAAPVLVVLFLGVIVYFYSPIFRWLLIIEHKEWWLPVIYGVGLLVNVALNLVIIPRFDILGVAVVNGVSELVILLACAYLVVRLLNLRLNFKICAVAAVASLVMVPFVWLFREWYLVGPLLLGGMVYIVALYVLGIDLIAKASAYVTRRNSRSQRG